MDESEFRRCGRQMVDLVADYQEGLRNRPVLSSFQPGFIRDLLPDRPPEEPDTWESLMADIQNIILPGMTHWQSPRFFAFYPVSSSYPSILAEILDSALGCLCFSWTSSPVSTELEMLMVDWFAKTLGLPDHFLFSDHSPGGGAIMSSASDVLLMVVLAARNRTVCQQKKLYPEMEEAQILGRMVAYTSDQAHSMVERVFMMGAVRSRLLESDPATLSLRGDALERAIREDRDKGLVPFCVVATLGTTNTCAFDDLRSLGEVCQRVGVWLHVDAAYAGSAFICPEYRHLMDGVEMVDSFSVNPHKWLLHNFECSVMWVKKQTDLTEAYTVTPEYLKHSQQGKMTEYRHWQVPVSRRFRALKMWFVFRMYGRTALQEHIRKHIRLAAYFRGLVESNDRLEIFSKPMMGLVCFRVKNSNEATEELMRRLTARRNVFLTGSRVGGTYFVRLVICSRFTEQQDVDLAWNEILLVLEEIAAAHSGAVVNGHDTSCSSF